MAETDCGDTFACSQCGAIDKQRTGRGRPFTRCEPCRNSVARPMVEIIAASPCNQDHVCEGCGSTFRPKRTDRRRFCSRGCAFASGLPQQRSGATRAVRSEARRREAEPLIAEIKAIRHMGAAVRRAVPLLRVLAARRQRMISPCAHCGGPLGAKAAGQGPTRYCSDDCAKRSPAMVQAKRIARQARKARKRGSQVEPVNPLRVFERDGWRCHLCGGRAPKERRGTYHPKAPELDHIVPLSKGGAHSYANTACAHRACNAAKSDRIIGQPSLLAA